MPDGSPDSAGRIMLATGLPPLRLQYGIDPRDAVSLLPGALLSVTTATTGSQQQRQQQQQQQQQWASQLHARTGGYRQGPAASALSAPALALLVGPEAGRGSRLLSAQGTTTASLVDDDVAATADDDLRAPLQSRSSPINGFPASGGAGTGVAPGFGASSCSTAGGLAALLSALAAMEDEAALQAAVAALDMASVAQLLGLLASGEGWRYMGPAVHGSSGTWVTLLAAARQRVKRL